MADFGAGHVFEQRYRLTSFLEAGGHGEVWRGVDLVEGREIAIKLVRLVGKAPEYRHRVRREADLLSNLRHASIVRCRAYFQSDATQTLGLVLDLVAGRPLSVVEKDPRFTDRYKMAVLFHVASALTFLHGCGIAHRDLKPENVLVGEGLFSDVRAAHEVTLIDLGISARVSGQRLTELDEPVGTDDYLSPEALLPGLFLDHEQRPDDFKRDVFAFGVLAMRLLEGRHPTRLPFGLTREEYAASYRSYSAFPESFPVAPQRDARLLRACLSLEPKDRLHNAGEILQLLSPPTMLPGATVPPTLRTPLSGQAQSSGQGPPSGQAPYSGQAPFSGQAPSSSPSGFGQLVSAPPTSSWPASMPAQSAPPGSLHGHIHLPPPPAAAPRSPNMPAIGAAVILGVALGAGGISWAVFSDADPPSSGSGSGKPGGVGTSKPTVSPPGPSRIPGDPGQGSPRQGDPSRPITDITSRAHATSSSENAQHVIGGLLDGDIRTGWCEPLQPYRKVPAPYIDITVDAGFTITSLSVQGGWAFHSPPAKATPRGREVDGDMWQLVHIATRLDVSADGGPPVSLTFDRARDRGQSKPVSFPSGARSVHLVVAEKSGGADETNMVCLDGFRVYGYGP